MECVTCDFVGGHLCPDHGGEDEDYGRWRELYADCQDLRDRLAEEAEDSEGDPVVVAELRGAEQMFMLVQLAMSCHPGYVARRAAGRAA